VQQIIAPGLFEVGYKSAILMVAHNEKFIGRVASDALLALEAGPRLVKRHPASFDLVQVLRKRRVAFRYAVIGHYRLPLVAVRYGVMLVAARLGFNDADCDQQCEDDNGSRDNVDRDSFENAISFCHL